MTEPTPNLDNRSPAGERVEGGGLNGPGRRARLTIPAGTGPIYAVGDVHGCLDLLVAMEARIVADAARLAGPEADRPGPPGLIVMLGDYVDRGPASAGVIDHLLAPPPEGFSRIALAGNHEAAFVDFLDGRLPAQAWLDLGAAATLASYGVRVGPATSEAELRSALLSALPADHLGFLRRAPVLAEGEEHIFVHAGLRPGVTLADQRDFDLLTIRDAFYRAAAPTDKLIVHGHTPVERADYTVQRLNIDTGAFYWGRLTAARIWQGEIRLLSVTR